jgi:voltage-dependent calcium channel alpha-2/delta-4
VEARRGHNKIQGNRSCIIFVTTTYGTFVMFSFQSYTVYNAQVETKKLDELLSEVRKDIESMMDRKCDAIKCISDKAEEARENTVYNSSLYQYYSSKYSNVNGTNVVVKVDLPPSLQDNKDMYLTMELNYDTHFYNISVDTSRSSVHVPTNIYDRRKQLRSLRFL